MTVWVMVVGLNEEEGALFTDRWGAGVREG